ncbi:mitochondrial import inner membrane translocase subunit Tim21-like isoform X3 [Microplitis mediator]|uniref:mitochondrial import inner membrane translocase subunit Tim21-like isoform X3 n=1 Tax=Microplitis mediator TaxID=375433 RepID=UPI002556D3BA|nr:mitochondrial import inner membrane translocase subunit Tim21-like isoform X3 [Microplitis mediator]
MASIRLINNIIRQKTCHYNRIPSLLSPLSLLLLCNGNKVIIKKYSNETQKSESTHFDNNATDDPFAQLKKIWDVHVTVVGVGIMAFMGYEIFSKLLSAKSPHSVYCKAADRCKRDRKVIGALGEPIRVYGEKGHGGRHRQAKHVVYQRNGRTYMRMQFYIQAGRKHGTVHLEMREVKSNFFQVLLSK